MRECTPLSEPRQGIVRIDSYTITGDGTLTSSLHMVLGQPNEFDHVQAICGLEFDAFEFGGEAYRICPQCHAAYNATYKTLML